MREKTPAGAAMADAMKAWRAAAAAAEAMAFGAAPARWREEEDASYVMRNRKVYASASRSSWSSDLCIIGQLLF